jgi:xylan 1,4-beta-xylosidase
MALASREHINLLGAVTWAFEFEDQPPFEGFRELATAGIDKPVLNAFRMFGLLSGERVKATSSGALSTEDAVGAGVRGQPDIDVIATRRDHEIEVLVWNYHDDDLPAAAAPIDLTVSGLPAQSSRGLLEHFLVDSNHSNAFTAWKEMGSPKSLSASQHEELERAGQLQLLSSTEWVSIENGTLHVQFASPRQGLRLLRVSW